MNSFFYQAEFVVLTCTHDGCGVQFGLDRRTYDVRKRDGGTFYCTNGHGRAFRDPEIDQVRRERDRLKQHTAYLEESRNRANNRADHAERSARAFEGRVTRLKNRAAAGVCPCCSRSFENLRRHMVTQHPDFRTAKEADEVVADKISQ